MDLQSFEVDCTAKDNVNKFHRVTRMKQVRASVCLPGFTVVEECVQIFIHHMIVIM